RARPARLKRAPEVRHRERRDLGVDSPERQRRVEGVEGLARLLQQIPLLVTLARVSVEAAERAEENLASDRELRVETDDARDFLELLAELVRGKGLGERHGGGRRSANRIQREPPRLHL